LARLLVTPTSKLDQSETPPVEPPMYPDQ
jgi:hypothetical protein